MNAHFKLIIFCVMVHSGVAFATDQVVFELLDSTAFNVAIFAMGWAATRWSIKGNESSFGIDWLRAVTVERLRVLLPATASLKARTDVEDIETDAIKKVSGDQWSPAGEPLQLLHESDDSASLLAGLSHLLGSRIHSTCESGAASKVVAPWRRSCFQSSDSSHMSLGDYIAHIQWFFECSSPCLVNALIYLDRALAKDTKLTLSSETCHRLFLTCLVAALKFHDDDWTPYPNEFYANVGHVGLQELNTMEKHLCKSIDWHFYVGPDEYLHYHDLITTAATTSHTA